jgi:16S rRNA processing protein RimM
MIHLIEAGHSYKVHGIKGELVIDFFPQYRKHILKSGVVFFMVEGNAVPFFINSFKESDDLLVRFKEIDTPEKARELSNQPVYIDDKGIVIEELKEEEEGQLDEINFLINFQIEDVNSGFHGRIKNLEEFPSQLMALVESDSKEFMIPIHEDWIVKIDQKKKHIRVMLPEGLLDL